MSYPPSSGQPTLGDYTLVREIARSNDIVWEGIDKKLNRRVAVKELQLPANLVGQARRDRIDRFYREARAAGKMNHPNIVTIHKVDEDHGRFFIAMEFLEGQTLRDRLTIGGALPVAEAIAIAVALCDALDYAHQRSVIHRDIKPDNIYLLPGGGVKLTDFGIARIMDEDSLTVAGQVFGTPSYMSPEQVVGRTIDARSDLFSLGILLYEMVSGRKPFTGDSVVTITYRIMNDPTPAIPGASPALENVIQRAMAKDPAARFGSANEFRAALLASAMSRTGSQIIYPTQPAPQPLPTQQSTMQYGAQTQFGIAPGYAAPVTAGPNVSNGQPEYTPPPSNNFAQVALAFGVFVLLLAMGAGGAIVLMRRQAAPPAAVPFSSVTTNPFGSPTTPEISTRAPLNEILKQGTPGAQIPPTAAPTIPSGQVSTPAPPTSNRFDPALILDAQQKLTKANIAAESSYKYKIAGDAAHDKGLDAESKRNYDEMNRYADEAVYNWDSVINEKRIAGSKESEEAGSHKMLYQPGESPAPSATSLF